jgi:hypothetical protein
MNKIITVDHFKFYIEGDIFEGDVELGIPDIFELNSMKMINGDICDLLDWATSLDRDWESIIEEKALLNENNEI